MAACGHSGISSGDGLLDELLQRELAHVGLRIPADEDLVLIAGHQRLVISGDGRHLPKTLGKIVIRAILKGQRTRLGEWQLDPFDHPFPGLLAWRSRRTRRLAPSPHTEAEIEITREELLPRLALLDPLLAAEAAAPSLAPIACKLRQLAKTRISVLVTGETGTGKDVLCRAIHTVSRRDGAFVAENCAALPDGLLEAELFGYRRGAFTGASHDREGRLQAAHQGTLFLDEIGDLSLPLQAKLLRVLQEKEVRPLGAKHAVPFDARTISATHRDLRQMLRSGAFRSDLYFRLAGSLVHIPPLRARLGDLPFLAASLLAEIRREDPRSRTSISARARAVLTLHDFPGNVRELQNVLRQAAALSSDATIRAETIREVLDVPDDHENLEAQAISRALALTDGVKAQAARHLGWSRQKLYRRLEALDFPC